jgi:peptidyl-prolyl cis-trans isomerase A (cyclophilin A)
MELMADDTLPRRRRAVSAMLLLRKSRPANATRWRRVFAARGLMAALWPVVLMLALAVGLPSVAEATIVRFETSMGSVDVRLYHSITPVSVANFLNYATSDRYDGTFIHRVPQDPAGGTADFVVQGGGFKLNNSIFAATGITTDAPIGNEFKISNTFGTLAYAKNNQGATSQWFFNMGNNNFLDADNFTVFGRVLGNGMTVVNAINILPTINAAAAQNGAGEDFDEVPVTNVQKVIAQNDITNDVAVMVNNVVVRNLPAGDYDFNGTVDAADYNVWKTAFGSTTEAAADGNGDGVVNAADYNVWRDTMGQTSAGSGGLGGLAVPEPTTAVFWMIATTWLVNTRRRKMVFSI